MRISYFGTYDRNRPRNRNIINGLKKNNIDVIECHYSLWGDIEDKSSLRGPLQKIHIFIRFLVAYPYLTLRYLLIGYHDAVIVGYLGHIDIFVAKPLTMLRRKPLIFDAFLSLYDTVVNDRKLSRPDRFIGRLSFFIDRTACRMADIVLLDTNAHIDYFVKTFKIPREKFRRVFVGADETQFYPKERKENETPTSLQLTKDNENVAPTFMVGNLWGINPHATAETLNVLFYGQFIPLHGIEYIVRAAKILEYDKVEFTIIGIGQEYNRIRNLADELKIKNIRWIDWVKFHKLVAYINEADIVLGIFGNSDKARRVIPNKAFQTIACKKPFITGDSPAARELFKDRENAVLCQMGDPTAIATSICLLRDNEDLRKGIAVNGYNTYLSLCNTDAVGKDVKRIINGEL